MNVNVQQLNGSWDLGYSLDKHSLHSAFTGYDQAGRATFDTTRSEAGEALYQLKYNRHDSTQIPVIASQLHLSFSGFFSSASLIVPMPPSNARTVQPVVEVARHLALKMGVSCVEDLLVKTSSTSQMKDINNRDEKMEELAEAFKVNDILRDGIFDVLVVDDLFDTGSSLEAVTRTLRSYQKIGKIYVATVTRKRDA